MATAKENLFDSQQQGSTTKSLLIEVARYAEENMRFNQCGIKAAGRRARKHLSRIMKLAKQRRGEISEGVKEVKK